MEESSSTGESNATEDQSKDSNPLSEQEDVASRYLKEHKILKLFENLTAALVYQRPEDPQAFAREFIEQLQKSKTDPDIAEPPSLVDESNLESIFKMLDISKKGFISHVQYTKAMENLGVVDYNEEPAGAGFNRINQDTFVKEANTALRKMNVTFLDS